MPRQKGDSVCLDHCEKLSQRRLCRQHSLIAHSPGRSVHSPEPEVQHLIEAWFQCHRSSFPSESSHARREKQVPGEKVNTRMFSIMTSSPAFHLLTPLDYSKWGNVPGKQGRMTHSLAKAMLDWMMENWEDKTAVHLARRKQWYIFEQMNKE